MSAINVNLNAAGDIIAETGVPVTPDALARFIEQQVLPADLPAIAGSVTTAMRDGMKIVQGAQPAFALMQKIGGGGVPNEQEVVAAMAATATLANPLAGAAIMAAGELVIGIEHGSEALFRALGLIADAPKPALFIGGLKRGVDPIPHGPTIGADRRPNPSWKLAEWFMAPAEFSTSGPCKGIPYSYRYQLVLSSTTQGSDAGNISAHRMTDLMYRLVRYGEKVGVRGPVPANPFEAFFFPILKKDIEHWWNANPYVPVRDLLSAAVGAWNHAHAGPVVHFDPPTQAQRAAMTAVPLDPSICCRTAIEGEIITYLLSAEGDPSGLGMEAGELDINMGPAILPAVAPRPVNRMAVRTGPMRAAVASTVAAIGRAAVAVPAAPAKALAAIQASKGPDVPSPIAKRPLHPSQWSVGEMLVACGAVGGVAALVLSRD